MPKFRAERVKNRAKMRKKSDLVLTWVCQNSVFITYANQKLFREILGGLARTWYPKGQLTVF